MKLIQTLIFCLAAATAAPAFADGIPGLSEISIAAPHHSRDMQVAIWYPAIGGAVETFAENPVFVGGEIRRDAKILPGKHPVILLSHGMGGSYLSLNWLASALASKGAIVVGVNHPNGWFRDRHPQKMFHHWTRVQDLQTALDHVLVDPALKDSVDRSRIFATGFSFGGWTALSIGGAIADLTGSKSYCKSAGTRSGNCTDLEHYGFEPTHIDPTIFAASYKDDRIKAVASIDPGLTWNMREHNVRNLDQSKLLVIGLGKGEDRMYATDTTAQGSGFDALVPEASIEILAPATHFTAMPLCKPAGVEILADEKDDPVCSDPPGTDRRAVHERIVELISGHFGL